MVVRARSVFAVLSGFVALPLSAQVLKGSFNAPTFVCTNGNVSGINWGDKSSISGAPMIGIDGALPAVQFGCSNNMYSAGVQGNTFVVDFQDFHFPSTSDKSSPVLFTYEYKEMIPGADNQWKYFTDFNLFIDVRNVDGTLIDKEFVGVKVDSMFGFSSGGDYKIMPDGTAMELDPTIPGGEPATISLFGTPDVPEPATLLLVGSGVVGGVLRRKRKAKA